MTNISKFSEFSEGLFDFFKKKIKKVNIIFTNQEYNLFKDHIYGHLVKDDPIQDKMDVDNRFFTGTIVSSITSLYKNSKTAEGDITTIEIFVKNGGNRNSNFLQEKATGYYTITKIDDYYYINTYKDEWDHERYLYKGNNIDEVCYQLNKSILIYKISVILEVKYRQMESLVKDYSLLTKDCKVNKFRLQDVMEELNENPAHFPLEYYTQRNSTISDLTLSIPEILEKVIERLQQNGIKINDN